MLSSEFDNIHVDGNSRHGFDTLQETEYLLGIFSKFLELEPGLFNNYDFFVFSSRNREIQPASLKVEKTNKILIYLSDGNPDIPSHLAEHYHLVFKHHLPYHPKAKTRVFPLPLGYVKGYKPIPIDFLKRDINVFFSGQINTNRIDFYKQFSNLNFLPNVFIRNSMYHKFLKSFFKMEFIEKKNGYYINFTRQFKAGLSIAKYSELLGNTKIALCPGGYTNPETFRHCEALMSGCVIISDMLPDLPYYGGSPIIQVDNWKEGMKKVRQLLKNPEEMLEIHKQSHAWYENHFSEKAVAKYMIDTIKAINV